MKRIGIFPFGWTFYSLCSAHQEPHDDCDTCKAGYWVCDTERMMSQALFKVSPKAWLFLMNSWPMRNVTLNRLKPHFPNLE